MTHTLQAANVRSLEGRMFTSSISVEGLAALIKSKDPVCGMEVENGKAAGVLTHKGVPYYFCSAACKTAFEADPERYVPQGA